MMQLNSNQIAEIIPHRYPFALVDRIVDGEVGKWAKGIKCVTVNEPFFQGHFPQYHVMPGVLIIEALAQVGAVTMLSMPENKGKDRPVRRHQKRPLPPPGHPRRRTGAGVHHSKAEGPGSCR